MNYSKFSTVD